MMNEEQRRPKEEVAVVLDFLPNGYPFENKPSHMKTPIVQALGKTRFVLLELVPKKGENVQPLEEIYIGEGKRDKIHHITGRLPFDKLTRTARAEVEFVLKDIIHKDEARFVEFFNQAKPLSTRTHSLEMLPGLGKKRMWEIVEERKVRPFTSLKEMQERVKLMPDPVKVIVSRILEEWEGKDKHYFFVER